MNVQTVGLEGREYDIWFGDGILTKAGELINRFAGGRDGIAIVTDETVWKLYGPVLATVLTDAGFSVDPIILPPGEQNKSLDGLGTVLSGFAGRKLSRRSLAIAFGGGVIGDLCGFAAASYMRGIRYLQIPTTLLAQVDSSVGGKTAINLEEGKNLVGAFHQPVAVLADTGVLRSLVAREWRCGMAEVIKYGAIRSSALFRELVEPLKADNCEGVVTQCCQIKSEIVSRDEHDQGERMLLNFGHTFGHAIEKFYNFSGFNHGEAVAVGMVIAAEVGEDMQITAPGTAVSLREVLRVHGLPTRCSAGTDQLHPLMAVDKKSEGNGVRLVLLSRAGKAALHRVSFTQLEETMRRTEARWKTND